MTRKTGGKQRMADAGRRNLAKWMREHAGEANLRHGIFAALCSGALPDDVKHKIEAFQASLESDLGGSVTAAEAALIASCRVSYSIVLLAQVLLERSHTSLKRARHLSGVLSVVGTHQAGLLRNLHALGVRQRRARSDENLDAEVDDVVNEIKAARGVSL